MFSSGNDNMETPQDFFNRLNSVFNFMLDACADEINKKCDLYYSKENSALNKSWKGQTVFCNPPYSKKE